MRSAHLGNDLRPHRRIPKASYPGLEPAVLDPQRHGGVQACRTRGVGVHVGGYADTRCPCRVDQVDDPIELAPIVLAGELQMIDLGRSTACLGNIDGFLDCRLDAVTFTAHVRCVDTAATGRFLRESDELRGLGEIRGRVDEDCSTTERALLHGSVNQGLHLLQLLWRGLHIAFAQYQRPYRWCPHERCDIGCDTVALEY